MGEYCIGEATTHLGRNLSKNLAQNRWSKSLHQKRSKKERREET